MSKIIDINDRVPARKRRRKIRTNLKFSILVFIFLCAILFLFYYQSDYSKVHKINISGNVLLDDSAYIDLATIKLNDSMWSFKEEEIEKELMKNEWVKDVEVKRSLLTKVNIKIEEWKKVAYIEESKKLYPMLGNGYVFKEVEFDEPINAPLFINFDDENIRKKIVKQLAKLKPEILELISQINLNATESDPYGIVLFMNDGYEVRAEISTFASKLNYYPSIIALIEQQESYEKGIIDIEVGSYYRPYSGEYQSISLEEAEATKKEMDKDSQSNSTNEGLNNDSSDTNEEDAQSGGEDNE